MVRQLHPNARDAAQSRVNKITVGIIAASVAGTLGLGAGIAFAAPPPKANNKTDYGQKTKNKKVESKPTGKNGQPQTNEKPESSSGDEETTSGGS